MRRAQKMLIIYNTCSEFFMKNLKGLVLVMALACGAVFGADVAVAPAAPEAVKVEAPAATEPKVDADVKADAVVKAEGFLTKIGNLPGKAWGSVKTNSNDVLKYANENLAAWNTACPLTTKFATVILPSALVGALVYKLYVNSTKESAKTK